MTEHTHDKIDIHFTMLTIFRVLMFSILTILKFSGIEYIHGIKRLSPLSSSRNCLSLQTKPLLACFPLPEPATYLSVSMELPVLNVSYEQNHATCSLSCLTSFTEHNAFRAHRRCRMCEPFIPFHGACQCRRCRFSPWVGKMPWRRKWQPTPELLPGKSRGQRSLTGCSPWGHKELGTTE